MDGIIPGGLKTGGGVKTGGGLKVGFYGSAERAKIERL